MGIGWNRGSLMMLSQARWLSLLIAHFFSNIFFFLWTKHTLGFYSVFLNHIYFMNFQPCDFSSKLLYTLFLNLTERLFLFLFLKLTPKCLPPSLNCSIYWALNICSPSAQHLHSLFHLVPKTTQAVSSDKDAEVVRGWGNCPVSLSLVYILGK